LSSLNHGVYVIEVTAWVSNTIYSNTLTHKIAVQKTDSALLLMGSFGKLEQYTEIPLNYLLVTNKERKNYTLNMKV
jgi:hypothetical protein